MKLSAKLKQWNFLVRLLTILIAIGLSIAVETIPVFLKDKDEKPNRVIYALIALVVTIIIENIISKIKFRRGLVAFIKQLKKIRGQYEVKPAAIQEIMKATTFQLAGVLEQTKSLDKENIRDSYNDKGNLPCGICTENHLTDFYSKCRNCKITSNFWKKVDSQP